MEAMAGGGTAKRLAYATTVVAGVCSIIASLLSIV
jgi:hypothetical protein